MATLALGFTIPATHAANFEASNETEFYQAIADAQASPDAASTITLTSSFQITSPPPAIAGKAITIDTGAFTLAGAGGTGITGPGGNVLNLGGPVTIVGAVTGSAAATASSRGVGGIGIVHTGGTITNSGQITGGQGGNTSYSASAGRTPTGPANSSTAMTVSAMPSASRPAARSLSAAVGRSPRRRNSLTARSISTSSPIRSGPLSRWTAAIA